MYGSNHTLGIGTEERRKKNKNLNHNTFSDSGVIKHGIPQGSILGPLLSLFYTNYLSKSMNGKSKQILFADDTSIIFTNSDLKDFNNYIKNEFKSLNK
jgi:hypothetical protein